MNYIDINEKDCCGVTLLTPAKIFRTIGIAAILFGCVLPCLVSAKPKLTITHFNHSQIEPFKQLIKSVYRELEYQVEFLAVPAVRGMLLLNEGKVDADVVRIGSNLGKYDNVLILQPALYQADLLLLCQQALKCTAADLTDPALTVLTSSGNLLFMAKRVIKAKQLLSEDVEQSLTRFKLGRADMLIYGATAEFRPELEKQFKVYLLAAIVVNHVIHKKHHKLKPKIEALLKQKLPHFSPEIFL